MARVFVSVVVLDVLGTAAGSAWASFPGRNGKIVYGWTGESAYRAGPTATSIRAVNPRSGRVRVRRDCPLRTDAFRTVFTDCTVSAPRYSPDGRRIAFPTIQTTLDLTAHPPWQPRPGLGTMASDGSGFEEHATGKATGGRLHGRRPATTCSSSASLGTGSSFGDVGIVLASLNGTELGQVIPDGTWTPDWSSREEAANTRSRASPRTGSGTGCSISSSTSGPPRLDATMRRYVRALIGNRSCRRQEHRVARSPAAG